MKCRRKARISSPNCWRGMQKRDWTPGKANGAKMSTSRKNRESNDAFCGRSVLKHPWIASMSQSSTAIAPSSANADSKRWSLRGLGAFARSAVAIQRGVSVEEAAAVECQHSIADKSLLDPLRLSRLKSVDLDLSALKKTKTKMALTRMFSLQCDVHSIEENEMSS